MFHFEVNEKKIGKEVSFTIKEAQMKKSGEKKILEVVGKKIEQEGGKNKKRRDDDSSSDDDDDDDDDDDSFSSSPYQLPYYVNPLRELLYYPMDYVIEYVPDVIYDYPLGIYYPSGPDYTILYYDY